jgi:type IV secretion system protein VirB9
MINSKITKKILPNTLPAAALLVNCLFPWSVLADGRAKTAIPVTESSGSRIKSFTYNESNVYVIRTKFGYQTNIVFGPKEEIQTISVGDRSLWQIIPSGNRLFIRPMNDDISTNMTLITNKHTYEFDLKSVDKKNESNIYVARFTYPEETPIAGSLDNVHDDVQGVPYGDSAEYKNAGGTTGSVANAAKNKQEAPISGVPAANPAHLNYSYTYAGPDSLAPLQVYDNGKSTFIKYQDSNQQKPDVFIIGANGKEIPANVTLQQDSTIVVGNIANEMLLRSNAGDIRIYNELLNPR